LKQDLERLSETLSWINKMSEKDGTVWTSPRSKVLDSMEEVLSEVRRRRSKTAQSVSARSDAELKQDLERLSETLSWINKMSEKDGTGWTNVRSLILASQEEVESELRKRTKK